MKFIEGGFGLTSPIQLCNHDTIPYHNSFEIDNFLWCSLFILIDDFICEVGDVHTAVRFAGDPELIFTILRKPVKPSRYCYVSIGSSILFIVLKCLILILTVANSWRILEVENIGDFIPCIFIDVTGEGFRAWKHETWPELLSETKEAGTTRSTIEPYNYRIRIACV